MLKPFRPSAATFLLAAAALLFGAALIPAHAVHAGQQTETPTVPPPPAPPRPAAVLFHESGCEHCHGVDGIGSDKGPSLLTVGKQLNKDAIRKQIHDGGGEMPAFADALQPDEIDRLVNSLAAKKKVPKGIRPNTDYHLAPASPAASSPEP